MSDYQLLIKIAGQLDGSLASSVKQAQSMLSALQKGGKGILGGAASAAATLAKANLGTLAVIGAAAGKVVKDAFKNGMDLENAMADLAGTAGVEIGFETYNQMKAAAQEVGRTTNKTSTEAAEALKYMSLAGWDAERSIASLDGMVKLSSATGLDLAETSDLVTDSMGALGLTARDYGRYLDLVATADASANYTAQDYMETMIKSGGAARNLGMGLEELSAMAGVLADNGLKGTAAGTAVNRMLRNMRTDTASNAFKDLGMSLYDAQGEFRGLDAVLGDLNKNFEGKTTEEINGYMDAIFGAFSSQGKYLLEAQKSGRLAELTGEYSAEAVAGAMERRYATMTDTLKGDLDILSSAYASFGESIYDSMNQSGSGIRNLVQGTTDYINQIHDAFDTGGALGIADEIGDIFGDIAGKIQDSGPAAVDAAFDFVDQLYQSIGSAENAEQIGSAAASIVTTLGERFITNTGEFAVAAGNLINSFTDGLAQEDAGSRIAEALSSAITNVGDWFGENGGDFGEAAGQVITQFVTGISSHSGEIISGGIQIISGLAQGIAQAIPILIAQAPAIVRDLAVGILDSLPTLLMAGIELGKAILTGLKQGLADIGAAIVEAVTSFEDLSVSLSADIDYDNLGTDMYTAIQSSMSDASSVFATLDSDAQGFFGQLAYGATTVSELNEEIQGMDPSSLEAMAATEAISAFVSQVDSLAEAGVATSDTMEAIGDAAETAAESVDSAAEIVEQAKANVFGGSDEDITLGFDGVTEELDALAESYSEAGDEISEAETMISDSMSALGDLGGDTLSTLLQSEDMQGKASEITAAMETVATGVTEAISTMQSGVADSMSALADSLSSASDAFSSLTDAASSAASEVAAQMATVASSVSDAMSGLSGVQAPEISGDPTAGLDTSTKEITVTMDASGVTAAVAEIQASMTVLGESSNTAAATFSAGMQVVASSAQSACAAASAAVVAMVAVMSASFAAAVASAQSSAQGIYAAFASIDLAGVAANMMAGLTAGIEAGGAAAVAAAQNIASQVAAAMSSALQINSPSKVTTEIGYYTGMGIPVGLESSLPETLSAVGSYAGAVTDRMDNSMSAPVAAIAARGKAGVQMAGSQAASQTSFSPTITININGNATEETAQEIASLTMDQFRRFYDQMVRQDRRVAFA